MNKRLLKLVLLLAFSILMLVGCSGQAKEYESFAPNPTAKVGEFFEIDSFNLIKINTTEIVEKGNDKILVINYSWRNEGTKADTTFDNFKITASQGGAALEPTLEHVKDIKKLVVPVDVGSTLDDIEQGFILESDDLVYLSILGSDLAFMVDNKPINPYPVKVEIDLKKLQ
ncbi:MAG: hypothetical protein GX323_08825 [Clostridiales bacterium]|nr:hypothetical protein [Clostridiales bacterium]